MHTIYKHLAVNIPRWVICEQEAVFKERDWDQNPFLSIEGIKKGIERVRSWQALDPLHPNFKEWRKISRQY